MASDSSEPARRRHHRSSVHEDADEHSKRRKHRHHRRHRSKRDKEETRTATVAEEEAMDVDESNLENKKDDGGCAVSEVGLAVVDYDMEEGEIVDHDGQLGGYFDNSKKNLDSDIESGEIKPNGYDDSIMGHNEEDVERVNEKSVKLGKDGVGGKEGGEADYERTSASEVLANGDSSYKYHIDDDGLVFGDSKRTTDFDEVEGRIQTKSSSSEKRNRAVSGSRSRDKYLKVSSQSSLSKSPERSRGRSWSRSILHEDSTGAPNKTDDLCYSERKHRRECNDERSIAHDRNYRHSSRDGSRDKVREHSYSRYTEQVEKQYGRDTDLKYRESSRERNLKRDRTVEKEREEEREKVRSRDRDRRDREREREREKETDRLKERERDRDHLKESARGGDRDRDYDREREDRNKDREREGFRARSRDNDRDDLSDRLSRRQKYGNDENSYRDRNNDSRHRRNSEDYHRERSRRSDLENLSSKGNTEVRDNENSKREIDGQEDYQERIELQLAEHDEEDDLERIKEESRRRRQAILEKYKNKQQKNGTQSQDMVKETAGQYAKPLPSANVNEKNTESQVEGADIFVDEFTFSVGKSPLQNGPSALKRSTGTGGLGEGTPKREGGDDIFSDDIFGESPAEDRKMAKGDDVAVEKSEFHDNWDDAEGYYGYRFGETLDGRYEIIAAHGKGVFSTVVRAKDLKAKPGHPEEVAIKIIRNNDTMYKAGMEERIILKKLVGADPENKRHCVRFLSTFKYRNHLCLVFESLNMDLRDVLKKFGRNIGLKLTAVRVYAKQLFIALKHLKNCGVLHCDIKPDNMLVNEAKNVLKLCDFGNAMFAGKNEITPYLVSRFYRAPEIILGLPYDHPMDMWSVGCCLFELYTGKVLFPGVTNNDMLRLHMELKGPFPKKMLRKGAFTDQHFDQDLNFHATEEDPVTKKAIRRLIVNIKPKDFCTLISGSSSEDPKMVADFKDLMEKLFVLDPDKRLTVSQALSHPFITGK